MLLFRSTSSSQTVLKTCRTTLVVTGQITIALLAGIASSQGPASTATLFPNELVRFGVASSTPLLAGEPGAWDQKIRERGWIIREGDQWHLWYTGYNETLTDDRRLGYATSSDGLNWNRWPKNPLNDMGWIEDMCVVKKGETYYMFAEGRDDIAHLLASEDRVHWRELGPLDIRMTNGEPIAPGPRGTPTVWWEDGTWWLFYERRDAAVYVATSKDLRVWTNRQDEPCLQRGPEDYDQHAVAFDQIIKFGERYYAYYHASALPKWGEWSTCIATSTNLVDWVKYPHNPIIKVQPQRPGASSGMVVHDGKGWRLYTTHPDVRIHFSEK